MNQTAKRLIFAAAISASCLLSTMYWYRWSGSQDKLIRENRTPVALLSHSSRGVERRAKDQVIWQDATVGEELYEGESIRTSRSAEALIEFKNSETTLNLEPESLIVLEKNSIDFKAGNLFLDFGIGTSQDFTVISEQGEVSTNSGSLSMGKGTDGDLQLQVLSGQALVRSKDKTVSLDTHSSAVLSEAGMENIENLITIQKPKPGDPVFADFDKGDKINISWHPIETGYTLHLESGTTRDTSQFSKHTDTGIAADSGNGDFNFPYNHKFWRLVALPDTSEKEKLTSPVFPIRIVRVRSPFPRSPAAHEKVTLPTRNDPIRFVWSNPMPYRELYIEVSDNPSLQGAKLIRLAQDSSKFVPELHLHNIEKPGTYYWRLTGYIDGYDRPITNPVQSFEVEIGIKLIAPKLAYPEDGERISITKLQEQGLFLRWIEQAGIKQYRLIVERHNDDQEDVVVDQIISQNFFSVSGLAAGDYSWRVRSVDQEDQSAPSVPRYFHIDDLPSLAWAEEREVHEYTTQNPKINFGFELGPEGSTKWRVKLTREGNSLDEAQWIPLSPANQRTFNNKPMLYWEQDLEESGSYIVLAQALDQDGNLLAQSSKRTILVQEKPKLPPPQFAPRMPASLTANLDGSIDIYWSPVEGAREYTAELFDTESGSLISEKKFTASSGKFNNLFPGVYSLQLRSIDSYGRTGDAGEKRELTVPDTSDIEAPPIEQFKVN